MSSQLGGGHQAFGDHDAGGWSCRTNTMYSVIPSFYNGLMIPVVITAAGQSRRYGQNKLWLLRDGLPLIAHTIHCFLSSPMPELMGPLALVVSAVDWDPMQSLANQYGLTLILGGDTRSQSVNNGLKWALDHAPLGVLVHDGARPFVSSVLIHRMMADPALPMAIPGLPVADTIKEIAGDRVVQTLSRDSLRAIQTPQYIRADVARQLITSLLDATDEAGVAEQLGIPVTVLAGDRRNIKVTWPGDWPGSSQT